MKVRSEYTIQELEAMNIPETDINVLRHIRKILDQDYWYRTGEMKVRIGNVRSNIIAFLMDYSAVQNATMKKC